MEIVRISHLSKIFRSRNKKTPILQDVNLSIKQWEVYGFLGANGVGKTTLLKSIFNYIRPTWGEIALFGTNDYFHEEYFRRIGYAPEVTQLYPFLRGKELMHYMGKLAGMSSWLIAERTEFLLETLGLTFASDRLIWAYSKGMKQRLSLAASLINDPELIFRDEPMSGLDPLGRILVKDLMKSLKAQGKTIFFNTHILSDVQEIADRFWILHGGKIVYEASPQEIKGTLEEFFTATVRNIDEHVIVR